MKKIVLKSVCALALGIGLVGCGTDDSSSEYSYLGPSSSGGTSTDKALKISKTDNGIKIIWNRTGKAKYYSGYTRLEVVNSIDTYKIASTNYGGKITIDCIKLYQKSDSTFYSCSPSNISHGYPLWLKVDSKNIVQERGGINEGDKTLQIGTIDKNLI